MLRSSLLRALVGAALVLGGCTVSPQPSPPDPDPPTLDGGLLDISTDLGSASLEDLKIVSGGPGSVDPPDGVVIITNLDNDEAPSIAEVADDGSFTIALNVQISNTLRFQVLSDLRSEPLDLRFSETAALVPPTVDVDCLGITPGAWLDLEGQGDRRSVVLRNDCAELVTIQPPRLRRGNAGLTFSPTAAIDLDPGTATTVTVHAVGGASEDEDVLYFDIAGPTAGRRAITITR